jgi:methionyl-tRNA formyltransferase
MFPLWKGKKSIYFGVIRSNVKVTVTINRMFDNRVVSHDNFSSVYRIFTKLGHMIPLWKGKKCIYFGVIRSNVKVTVTINRMFDNRVVSHDNFSSVYRILTKLGHMIPMWKGKNPIYFGIIKSKVKVTVTINIIFDNMIVSA